MDTLNVETLAIKMKLLHFVFYSNKLLKNNVMRATNKAYQ